MSLHQPSQPSTPSCFTPIFILCFHFELINTPVKFPDWILYSCGTNHKSFHRQRLTIVEKQQLTIFLKSHVYYVLTQGSYWWTDFFTVWLFQTYLTDGCKFTDMWFSPSQELLNHHNQKNEEQGDFLLLTDLVAKAKNLLLENVQVRIVT